VVALHLSASGCELSRARSHQHGADRALLALNFAGQPSAAAIPTVARPNRVQASTDTRADGFVQRHGELVQVELEALDPAVLRKLFGDALRLFWDVSAFERSLAQEREDIEDR
jgi:hypothetical protein